MPRSTPKPVEHSLLEDVPFLLARAALNFRKFNEHTLREVGVADLAPGFASVLHALDELGDCTVSMLVEQTHLPNGTLTGVLDTLEGDRYIERRRNPEDGRSWLIKLTASGRRLCAKLHTRHRAVMEVFRAAFTKSELAALSRLLVKASNCMRAQVPTQRKRSGARRASRARKQGA